MSDLDPPSWLADPTGRHQHRYWDGSAWTDHVADEGEASLDPYTPGSPATSDPPATPAPWTASAPPPAPEGTRLTWRSGSSPTPPPGPVDGGSASAPPATGSPGREPDWEPQWDDEPSAPPAAEPARLTGWATPDDIVDAPAPSASAPTAEATPIAGVAPTAPTAPATPVVDPPPPTSERAAIAPPPPPGPSGGEGGRTPGGRRKLVLGLLALLVLVGVGIGVALAGGGTDERERQEGYVRALLQGRVGSVSDEDLRCLAEAVVDDLGVEEAKALHLEDIDEDSTSFPEELLASLQTATSTCAVTFADGAGDDGDDGDARTTRTTESLSVDEQARRYLDEYDLTAIQAECLAEANAEVRDAETLTREEILRRIRDCDVDPAVLGVEDATATSAAG